RGSAGEHEQAAGLDGANEEQVDAGARVGQRDEIAEVAVAEDIELGAAFEVAVGDLADLDAGLGEDGADAVEVALEAGEPPGGARAQAAGADLLAAGVVSEVEEVEMEIEDGAAVELVMHRRRRDVGRR